VVCDRSTTASTTDVAAADRRLLHRSPVSSARDLGVYVDSDLSMRMQVQRMKSQCFAALCQLRQIRRSVPLSTRRMYFLHLSLSSVILNDSSTSSPVHVLMLSIHTVCGLPHLHLALFLALSLSPGNSLVSSWCDYSMLASLLWQCLAVPSLLQVC